LEAANLYLKVDFTGCIPSGYSPRLYHINFYPIIARRLRRLVLVMIIPSRIVFV